jgi:hypothetical protein
MISSNPCPDFAEEERILLPFQYKQYIIIWCSFHYKRNHYYKNLFAAGGSLGIPPQHQLFIEYGGHPAEVSPISGVRKTNHRAGTIMGTKIHSAKTNPCPWDAFSDVDAFVAMVSAELAAMKADGTVSSKRGPKVALDGAMLDRAILSIWCVCFCGMQWRAVGKLLCNSKNFLRQCVQQ